MSKSSEIADTIRFALLLARNAPKKIPKGYPGGYAAGSPWPDHWTTRDALAIIRASRGMSRIAVIECERSLTPREDARYDRLHAAVVAKLKVYGAPRVELPDPRGPGILVHFPGNPNNGFGGEGWEVW